MKKESSTNLQKYSGIAEQMVKMSSDCPEITKMILDIIYGDEGEGNRISTISQTAQRLRNPGQKSISRDGQKVIIENSRGLRLGFFIFLFLNCYVCIKTRNSKIHTPGLQIQIRIPPSSLSRHKPVHLQQVAGIMPN